jgi:hypothetical protein
MSLARARSVIAELDQHTVAKYEDYIHSIAPKDAWEVAKRWIFAFCSIHTTWESNVRGYEAVVALGPDARAGAISEALEGARTGLHRSKGEAIGRFLRAWRKCPEDFAFKPYQAKAQRDTHAAKLHGIGLAKTSFACELISPAARVTCLDVHTLRWITGATDLNGNIGPAKYRALELQWQTAAREFGYNPTAARHATWDRVQGQSDMRYWSYVLES